MSRLEEQLEALATLSPAQLRGTWLQTFKSTPPDVSHRLLALDIGYRLQERALGGLASQHGRDLARLATRFAKTGAVDADAAATLKAGSRLVREWQGKVHQVLIREDGYVYGEQHYGSLSQIARHITGTSWSGPRFFGLQGKGRGNG